MKVFANYINIQISKVFLLPTLTYKLTRYFATYINIQINKVFLLPTLTYKIDKVFLLPISTPFWMAFAICSHFIPYMYTHSRVNFMLCIHTYVHLLEKQSHVTHSRERNFFFTTHSYFEKKFHAMHSHFDKYFRAIFSIYAYGQGTWLPIQHIYTLLEWCLPLATYANIHTYMVNNLFTSSRRKESSWYSPHQHALIFMPSCTKK